MIECTSCRTLNPDEERICLACGATLAPATKAATGGAARCPAGHPIDPSWKSCPYCDRLRDKGELSPAPQPTRLEGASPESPSPTPGPSPTRLEADAPPRRSQSRTRLDGENPPAAPPEVFAGRRPTRLEEPAHPSRGRRTVLQEPASPPAAEPPAAPPAQAAVAATSRVSESRRLVAVLAAPGLGSGGTLFPIRAGKNVLGADRNSDVVLAADPQVSQEHAVILYRDGNFHLADRLSTNGTWLNGGEVPTNGTVTLSDRDRLRVGSTDLVFLVIDSEPNTPQETAKAGD